MDLSFAYTHKINKAVSRGLGCVKVETSHTSTPTVSIGTERKSHCPSLTTAAGPCFQRPGDRQARRTTNAAIDGSGVSTSPVVAVPSEDELSEGLSGRQANSSYAYI